MAAAPIPWSSASAPIDWDVIAINWNTAAKANTATYGALSDQAVTGEGSLSPEVVFGALADQSNTGIKSMDATASLGALGDDSASGGMSFAGNISIDALADQSVAGGLTLSGAASFGALGDYVNATNHSESVSIEATADWSSLDAFLWNDVADVSTTWTKVEYPN